MIFIFLYFLSILTGTGHALEVPAQSIDVLLEKAVENSLSVKAQNYKVEQQKNLNSASTAWANPSATIESLKGSDNTNMPINKYQVSLIQPLTSPWKNNIKQKIANSELNIEKHHLEDEILSIKINTLRMIFNYNIAMEKMRKVDAHIKRIGILKLYLKSRKFISSQKQAEAFVVENRVRVLKKQLDDLKTETQNLWLQLNQYLQLSDRYQLPAYWVDQTLVLEKLVYLQKAQLYNHDIELAQFQVEKSQGEHSFEQNQKLPDVALVGALSKGKTNNPEDNFSVGVNLSIPLFNMNIQKSRASANALEQAKTRKALIVQQVLREYESTFLDYELARQQIKEFPLKTLGQLEKDMQRLTEGFKKGQIDLMTFVEADVTHDTLIDETLRIQMNYIHALSKMSFLVGEMIPLKGVVHDISL